MTTPDKCTCPHAGPMVAGKWTNADCPVHNADKPPTDTNPGDASGVDKDKLPAIREQILGKIHLAVRTKFFTEQQKDMQFLADDVMAILAAALQEQDTASRLDELTVLSFKIPEDSEAGAIMKERFEILQAKQQKGQENHE